jgi:protein SCO1/2
VRPGRAARLAATVAAAVALSVGAAGCGGGQLEGDPAHNGLITVNDPGNQAPHGLHGIALPKPAHKPAITLTDTAGRSYDLRTRTAGKLTIVYFGYTHCPDICPTTMARLAQALREVPASVARKTVVVFISVDPKRDTSPVLRRWLDHFNPQFVGLRGSIDQVIAAQQATGVPTARKEPSKKLGYTLQHSAEILTYGPDGLGRYVYTAEGTPVAAFAHDLPILAKGSK